MTESNDPQEKLDAAQADLESDVAALKDVVEEKLETPKKALEKTKEVADFVRAHAIEISIAAAAAVAAVGVVWLLRRR